MITVPLNLWNWPSYKFILYRVKFYLDDNLVCNCYGNSYLEFKEENETIVAGKINDLILHDSDIIPSSFDRYLIYQPEIGV